MLMPSIFGENLFDDFFNDFPFYDDNAGQKIEKKLYGRHGQNLMKTDIKEMEDGYELEMDLPGFPKESIKAELKGGYLTILASYTGSDREDREGSYIKKERYSGHYKRSFYVGDKVSEQDIKARFANGVLYVYVPKFDDQPEVEEKKIISIEG